jgi:hypothetical protein
VCRLQKGQLRSQTCTSCDLPMRVPKQEILPSVRPSRPHSASHCHHALQFVCITTAWNRHNLVEMNDLHSEILHELNALHSGILQQTVILQRDVALQQRRRLFFTTFYVMSALAVAAYAHAHRSDLFGPFKRRCNRTASYLRSLWRAANRVYRLEFTLQIYEVNE